MVRHAIKKGSSYLLSIFYIMITQ